MYGPVNLIKLLEIPNNLSVFFFFFFSLFFSFLCETWESDVVSDFHSWGRKFGAVGLVVSLHWGTIYGTQCMKRRCFDPRCLH